MNNKRIPFEEGDVIDSEPNVTPNVTPNVKLDQSRSRFSKPKKDPALFAKLEERVQDVQEKDKELFKEAFELSTKFMSIIKNRTLKENKSEIEADLESEVVKGLTNYAFKLDNDDTQPEGIGSVGVITLLLRVVLAQRDIINNIDYKYVQLEKQFRQFKSSQ